MTESNLSSQSSRIQEVFGRFAAQAAQWLGSTWAFLGAGFILLGWMVTGPIFHFSDAWQQVINTITNVATFLMVFVIQNAQNRDSKAINLKLNEVIRATDKAHDHMIDIEKLSDAELTALQTRYENIRQAWIKRNADKIHGAE